MEVGTGNRDNYELYALKLHRMVSKTFLLKGTKTQILILKE